MINYSKHGTIQVEVSLKNIEGFINELWENNIKISNLKKDNKVTICFVIDFANLDDLKNIVNRYKGKIRIINKFGMKFKIDRLKKKKIVLICMILFLSTIIVLSQFIWAIEIKTTNNITPYEVRKNLKELGIEPGIMKKDINVYELEKKLENINSDIVWIWSRIEGGTLKLKVEEKVNPPSIDEENKEFIASKYDAEIKRIYVNSGKAMVTVGDIVKKGDALINGVHSSVKETEVDETKIDETKVKPSGVVIGNTFYEKKMELQVKGKKLVRTGKYTSDIYLSVTGKKIYLKKSINMYGYYDKIEEKSNLLTKVYYYEKKYEEINESDENLKKDAINKLRESLTRNLKQGAKIISETVSYEAINSEKLEITVNFVVEQELT